MKEAFQSIAIYWFISNLMYQVRFIEGNQKPTGIKKVFAGMSSPVRAVLCIAIFVGLFGYQVQNYIKTKEPNYFELLELENTMPSPILVKKQFKDVMNKIAQEKAMNP